MIKPILAASGNKPFLLLTPMLRYVAASCCDSGDHLTNKSEPVFQNALVEELEEGRKNFRSFLFADNIRRAVVMNPTHIMLHGEGGCVESGSGPPAAGILLQVGEGGGRPDGEHQRQEEASDEGHGMQVNEGPEWIHRSAERDHLGRARGRWRGGRDGGGGSFLGGDRQGRYV